VFSFVFKIMAQFQVYRRMFELFTNYVTRPFNNNKIVLLIEFVRQLTR
jgi:hypothetical protein